MTDFKALKNAIVRKKSKQLPPVRQTPVKKWPNRPNPAATKTPINKPIQRAMTPVKTPVKPALTPVGPRVNPSDPNSPTTGGSPVRGASAWGSPGQHYDDSVGDRMAAGYGNFAKKSTTSEPTTPEPTKPVRSITPNRSSMYANKGSDARNLYADAIARRKNRSMSSNGD